VFRALREQFGDERIEIAAVNDLVGAGNLAYLLKYDSVQGRYPGVVEQDGDALRVDGRRVEVLQVSEGPAALPWRKLGVDLVVEASGAFTSADKARGHLEAGARKVLITAPAKGEDLTVVLGVNEGLLDLERHHILSNASCTTNFLAPLIHVLLKEGVGVEEGLMTTVHAYTASQKTIDGPSAKDWRGGRNAATNIIPSSTGAAKAVGLVIPEMQGRLTGMSLRVPVATVSVVDLTFRSVRPSSLEEIHALMRAASGSYLKNILACTADQVVSSDFIHDPHSAIYDETAAMQLNERFFKLVAWYDNEWAYACRVADLAGLIVERMR
jgi:glyceraldehyde 3-phosphate dehydrogenase